MRAVTCNRPDRAKLSTLTFESLLVLGRRTLLLLAQEAKLVLNMAKGNSRRDATEKLAETVLQAGPASRRKLRPKALTATACAGDGCTRSGKRYVTCLPGIETFEPANSVHINKRARVQTRQERTQFEQVRRLCSVGFCWLKCDSLTLSTCGAKVWNIKKF